MVRTDLESIIGNLGAFYERKARPSEMTLELWMQKVKNIPSEAIPWIQDKIMDECEYWPKNITATMWAFYNAWLQANPHKRAFAQERDCPDCEGGWLVLQKRLPMYAIPISHSAPCGRCKQVPAAQYMTLFQAKEKGFERVNLFDHNAPKRTVKEMIASIGRPVPTPRVYCD